MRLGANKRSRSRREGGWGPGGQVGVGALRAGWRCPPLSRAGSAAARPPGGPAVRGRDPAGGRAGRGAPEGAQR